MEKEENIEKLKEDFDEWVECTGVVMKNSSYYYEVLYMIENAYNLGRAEINQSK